MAEAVHAVASAYGSLSSALDMTPRQLSAALSLERRRRCAELLETMNIMRAAQHAEKAQYEKIARSLEDV